MLNSIYEMSKILNECCNVYDEQGNHIRNKCSECEYWSYDNQCCCSYSTKEAEALFNAGYRKASDVVNEIFSQLELYLVPSGEFFFLYQDIFANLKNRYLTYS